MIDFEKTGNQRLSLMDTPYEVNGVGAKAQSPMNKQAKEVAKKR